MGDSRSAGYFHNDKAMDLSVDHKPSDANEKKIIESRKMYDQDKKMFVHEKRVNGILAVSRAIGDASLNLYRKVDIKEYDASKLLLICTASDGIWDHFNST